MFPLTQEARSLYEISLSGTGALKKKELLDILLLYEELTEREGFLKATKRQEAIELSALIDKISLAYFRALEGHMARSYVLELSRLVDAILARMIMAKYR